MSGNPLLKESTVGSIKNGNETACQPTKNESTDIKEKENSLNSSSTINTIPKPDQQQKQTNECKHPSGTETSTETNFDSSFVESIIFGCKEQGAKTYQEDSYCIFHSPDMSVIVAGVFDGHGGINGKIASQTVNQLCITYYQKHWKECKSWNAEQWEKNMCLMFEDFHFKVRQEFIALETQRRKDKKMNLNNIVDGLTVRKPSGFPMHGGTTCTIVTIVRTADKWRIISANVGDSDALLLARKPSRLKEHNKCMHLSIDHSPDNTDEFLRIQNLDKEAYPTKLMFIYDKANMNRKFECPIVFLKDGTKDPKYVKNPWGNHLRPTNVRYDPAVYAVTPFGVSYDITCIAMTRSLGDFYAHQFGISCVPSVTINELDIADHEYMITVGSDGIWDCWKWDVFADYVNGMMSKHNNNLPITTQEVLRHTVQRAKACFGVSSYDDASLVFVSLRSLMYDMMNVSSPVPSQYTISSSSSSYESMPSHYSNASVCTDVSMDSNSNNNMSPSMNKIYVNAKNKNSEEIIQKSDVNTDICGLDEEEI